VHGDGCWAAMAELRAFMFERVYPAPRPPGSTPRSTWFIRQFRRYMRPESGDPPPITVSDGCRVNRLDRRDDRRFCIRAFEALAFRWRSNEVNSIQATQKDRVRDRGRLIALVSARHELRRAGVNSYFGRCPFHRSGTASSMPAGEIALSLLRCQA